MKVGDLVRVEWIEPTLFSSALGVILDTGTPGCVGVEVLVDGFRTWLDIHCLEVINESR